MQQILCSSSILCDATIPRVPRYRLSEKHAEANFWKTHDRSMHAGLELKKHPADNNVCLDFLEERTEAMPT